MKKIIAIISGCLVAILLTVTIVLACTKFTAATIVKYDKIWAMEVYNANFKSDQGMTLSTDSETYKDIMRLYQESLKENNLSSLFQGAKGFDESEKVKNEEVKIADVIDNKEGTYVVHLMYSEKQFLQIDGENVVDEDSKTKEAVKFDSLYVEVKNTANFTEYKIYLADSGSKYSSWNVSLIAQQSDLYAYIADLKYQY